VIAHEAAIAFHGRYGCSHDITLASLLYLKSSTMAFPIGSAIFYAVSLIVVSLLVLLLLRYYLPLRSTPAYLLIPVFLAVALPANLILLVPIDLASKPVIDENPRGIWLPQRGLLVAWRLTYWLTFALTWLILPLLGEYTDSGEREWRDKMMYSLRSNGKYHLMVIGAGSVGAVYFIITEGFNFTSLRALVMALAYAWGLILAIYLMGHGLVAVPRKLFRDADPGRRLRKLQNDAPKVYEKLIEASDELDSYEYQVNELEKFKNPTARNFRSWILELADMTSLPDSRVSGIGGSLPTSRQPIPQVITAGYLADLGRKLKRARHKKLRYMSEWDSLLQDAIHCQTILDAKPSGRLVFPNSQRLILSPYLRSHLHTHVLPALSYFGGVVLSAASVSIIWSELTKQLFPHLSVISRTVVPTKALHVNFFPSQLFAAFWVTYMSICALHSITVLPIWGNRALVRRTTYPESATWYAAQIAKLTVPLAFNFLTFLPRELPHNTMFYHFLGQYVDLTPLGRGFSGFFPILLLLPVLAALFGWYSRIKAVLGFEDLLAEDEREDSWREGRGLIERHVKQRSGPGSLGLEVAPGSREASLDIPRAQQSSGEAAGPSSWAGRTSSAPKTQVSAAATRMERRPLMHEEDDYSAGYETNAFSDFAHRVRNTFDQMERPSWLRWGENAESESTGGTDRNWNRIFGGGQGRVRL
jgi:LMBR1-like membrane protein